MKGVHSSLDYTLNQIKSNLKLILLTCDQKLPYGQFSPKHAKTKKIMEKLKQKPLSSTESVKVSKSSG